MILQIGIWDSAHIIAQHEEIQMQLRKPLNDLYEHREDIGSKRLFIVKNSKSGEEFARFNVFEIPNLSEDILEKTFKKSITNKERSETIFFVE